MLKFKEYITQLEQNTVGYHNDGQRGFERTGGAFLSSDQTGSETDPSGNSTGHPNWLPSTDLAIPDDIPTMTRTSTIQRIDKNKNPITITLKDGTILHFTWDEFKRIKVMPEVGKAIKVTFQKNQLDQRPEEPGQISNIQVY
jgi:YD repeat-containing protein